MPGGSKMAPAMHRIEIHIYRIAAAVSIWLAAAGTQCLKITEKVAFNIASEASYVYILSCQKFIKIAKNG